MININDLIVTQHNLRHCGNLASMSDYVKEGGVWSKEYLLKYAKEHYELHSSPLINLSKFEDGKIFIQDGHHRISATHLSGRSFLYPEEYILTNWTYKDYIEENIDKNWITPFDPRIECRMPNLSAWKKTLKSSMILRGKSMYDSYSYYIHKNRNQYCEPRRFHKISELISNLNIILEPVDSNWLEWSSQ